MESTSDTGVVISRDVQCFDVGHAYMLLQSKSAGYVHLIWYALFDHTYKDSALP